MTQSKYWGGEGSSHLRISYPAKLSSISEGKIKTSPDKQKLRDFIAWDQAKYMSLSYLPYFAVYSMLRCVMHTHVFGSNFQENIFHFNFLVQFFIYIQKQNRLLYSKVLFAYGHHFCFLELYFHCIRISLNKRIKNIYIDTELILPMYNVLPYFSLKNLGKKCLLCTMKYGIP